MFKSFGLIVAALGLTALVLTHVVGVTVFDGNPAVVSYDGIHFRSVILADHPSCHRVAAPAVCEVGR